MSTMLLSFLKYSFIQKWLRIVQRCQCFSDNIDLLTLVPYRETRGYHKELQVHVHMLWRCSHLRQHLALRGQLHQLPSAGERTQTGDVQASRTWRAWQGTRLQRRWTGVWGTLWETCCGRRCAERNKHLNFFQVRSGLHPRHMSTANAEIVMLG